MNGWHPVIECGIPFEWESKRVLIAWADRQEVSVGFQTTSYEWCDVNGRVLKHRPTHWQPFPAPPEKP